MGVKKLATAHQANDQAETFLMHWIQGSGLKGLSGIPISRDYVYQQKHFTLLRPLILATREEILSYAQKEKLKFFKDPSNTDQKYLRTRLRRLVGQLEKENLNFIERTAKNALLLQADESFLNEKVEELFYEGVDIVGGQWQCPFVFFQEVPRSLQYRLLQKIIHEISGEALSFDRIVAMLRFLETKDSEKAFSLSGLSLRKEKTHFYFSK
ncbi:MAG: tRNA lysidine(34) synthetase TilS [Deltaproteobacteria bacterium]|nr:MAG: tRNA lysidine(34) synthetase TilS [Deltaproteobacteria bacterium]